MKNTKMQNTCLCICCMRTIHTDGDANLNKYASVCKFITLGILSHHKDTYQWPNRTKKKTCQLAEVQEVPRGLWGLWGHTAALPGFIWAACSKAPVQSAEMHTLKHQSYKHTNLSGQQWASKPHVLRVKITVWRENREMYSFSSSSVSRPCTAAIKVSHPKSLMSCS